ncbi:3-isopropylmalate dehydratase small subunit [Alteromonas lipolytica]|uniref:3-isopropylmalate dehydratase small subunit n=1 Tax=Alteromonas lipolytica TaxID=1856405 RepID=A0A1E8FBS6_9ALTE|nr:3-isopropylmalate dehydratase small subunit [Alteromonas lipolytica]OFI33371.1 3-isopropylmalate dehydratase small subunit [Alteromonas lipolytica]GGF60306.1 3-isopropylmalate dehydratase small subunit [Alteromonas lipolytica]
MKPFTQHTGQVYPFDRANIDTDAILPKQYLKSIRKFGYGDWLFDDLRYLDGGDVTTPVSERRKNPDFLLNHADYAASSVLLARDNFGCGSSREHAVWALRDYGFAVVLAPSFADIFYNNCFKNGLLPIALPNETIDELFAMSQSEKLFVTVDLQTQSIFTETHQWHFDIDESRRQNLLEGLDEISVTLKDADTIHAFEDKLKQAEPWVFQNIL